MPFIPMCREHRKENNDEYFDGADDYTVSFAKEYHGRCFMSKNIFAYLAYRIGFKILNQEIIDWYGEKQLDCITLLEK